ncbi:hypothetical protein CNR22_01645 [Sphingobacteriaceae bacterium]|nr:hypothetical protein CNR22_01645 [Sphingobacteriaceae bacterium]
MKLTLKMTDQYKQQAFMELIKEERLNEFVSQLKGYSSTELELLKLRSVEKIASAESYLLAVLLPYSIFMIALVFLSIAAALYLSHLLGTTSWGFALVGAFYLLIAVVFFLFKNRLAGGAVQNKIISILTADIPQ